MGKAMPDLKPYPMEHFSMNPPEIKFEDGTFSFKNRIYAEVVDMKEDAIVHAVISDAMECGVTDLYLLDKNFVINALTTAIEAWNRRAGEVNDV